MIKLPTSNVKKQVFLFLKSTDFSNALMIGFAVTIPIVLGIATDYLDIGMAIGFGAFWSSPSYISGNPKHRQLGILFSAGLITLVTLIGGYLHAETWITLPILGVMSFAISYLSVYGFRASLISFSGLLALVLSLAFHSDTLQVYEHAFFVGVGGLWFLLLAILFRRINPHMAIEQYLYQTYTLTADILETRGKLVSPESDYTYLQYRLRDLQIELTENHSVLREMLMYRRAHSGKSSYQGRRLLVFVRLVEMLETALANPVNYEKMYEVFNKYPEYISSFQNLILGMADTLRQIADSETSGGELPKIRPLRKHFEKIQNQIAFLERELQKDDYENFVMLQNFLDYQEKQLKKLRDIVRLLGTADVSSMEAIDKDAPKLFLAEQDYSPRILFRNLSFKSNIFRHSLRLSVTLMVGFAIGMMFDSDTAYWILLSIVVILRPGYSLTKSRSKDRILGTVIGGLAAMGIVLLVENPYVLGAFGIVSLIMAFATTQKNYRTSAAFVTLSVVFIYAIIRPDILTVIQYRIVDTLVGAALSFAAVLWIWPLWSYIEINESLLSSIKANRTFLAEISKYYQEKGHVPLSYKFSRKQAFLETSNLSSAFQQMTQEPKSKQRNMDAMYELVELNHNFLGALASLSTYIQHNPTTKASDNFRLGIEKIDKNLQALVDILEYRKDVELTDGFDNFYETQIEDYRRREIQSYTLGSKEAARNYQEAHLIWEQLEWLFSLSANMLNVMGRVGFASFA